MIIELQQVVAQPLTDVFPVLADIGRRPEWVKPAVERTPLTADPVGPGSTYRAIDEYPGRRVEFVHELRAFEHGRLLEESWTGPMAGTMVTRFTAVDDSTELAISMEINASGTAKILAPLMKRWLVRALRKDFVRLESMLAAGK